MAATKYQVLYRYINEATNTPITNDMNNEYVETCEFYTDPHHKIFSSNEQNKKDATREQQEMIMYENSSSNPKTNMLFVYNGTKKVYHKQWVTETDGYIVRDWSQIPRNQIGDQGDYSKDFTTLNAKTPEDGGTVVCTKAVFDKYFDKDIIVSTGGNYTSKELMQQIINATMFKLKETENYREYTTASHTISYASKVNHYLNETAYTGPVAVDVTIGTISCYHAYSWATRVITANTSSYNLYGSVLIKSNQVEKTKIPAHYEEQAVAPYYIKDTYTRLKLSPWFVNSTFGSLEAALTKAELLVKMIGLENVKIIKLVPFDQFIKIK